MYAIGPAAKALGTQLSGGTSAYPTSNRPGTATVLTATNLNGTKSSSTVLLGPCGVMQAVVSDVAAMRASGIPSGFLSSYTGYTVEY